MGFSSLLDILGSTVIGGMLLLILLRMNDNAIQNNYAYGGELIVQEGLVEAVSIIEYDFRKIGYCQDYTKIPLPSKSILSADSNSIEFLTDLAVPGTFPQGDGIVDTLRYQLGPVSELTATVNPRDRMLYRIVNNETPRGSNIGITEFKLTYFDAIGDTLTFPITTPSLIYTLQIDIKIENLAAYDEQYSDATWRQVRLAARNLRNR